MIFVMRSDWSSTIFLRRLGVYHWWWRIVIYLFVFGIVFIIILVLSLIPVYLSNRFENKKKSIAVLGKIILIDRRLRSISIVVLALLIPTYTMAIDDSDQSIEIQRNFDRNNNQKALEAALTSMIQDDPFVAGSILEIQILSESVEKNLSFNLLVTSNCSCLSTTCSNQYQTKLTALLTDRNLKRPIARYEPENSTVISWIEYRLPAEIQSSSCLSMKTFMQGDIDFHFRLDFSIVTIDLMSLSSLLERLLLFNQMMNRNSLNKMNFSMELSTIETKHVEENKRRRKTNLQWKNLDRVWKGEEKATI